MGGNPRWWWWWCWWWWCMMMRVWPSSCCFYIDKQSHKKPILNFTLRNINIIINLPACEGTFQAPWAFSPWPPSCCAMLLLLLLMMMMMMMIMMMKQEQREAVPEFRTNETIMAGSWWKWQIERNSRNDNKTHLCDFTDGAVVETDVNVLVQNCIGASNNLRAHRTLQLLTIIIIDDNNIIIFRWDWCGCWYFFFLFDCGQKIGLWTISLQVSSSSSSSSS